MSFTNFLQLIFIRQASILFSNRSSNFNICSIFVFEFLFILFFQSYNNHHKTAVTLLDHGADVLSTDDRGMTPLDLAKSRKMKMTLKEAWTEASKTLETGSEVSVGSIPKEKESQSRKNSASSKKKQPEVIFDVCTFYIFYINICLFFFCIIIHNY